MWIHLCAMGDMSSALTLEMFDLIVKLMLLVHLCFFFFAAIACAITSKSHAEFGFGSMSDMDLNLDQAWIWIGFNYTADSPLNSQLCVSDRPGSRRDPVRGGLLDGAVPIELWIPSS